MEQVIIDYNRQHAIFDPALYDHRNVTIIGCGNIGSNTAIQLAHLGIKNIVLYDFDKVEVHNLTSQHYGVQDLGEYKVDALARQLKDINPEIFISARADKYSGIHSLVEADIIVVAVDSMDARREIHDFIERALLEARPRYIIDGRIGGPQLEIYTCTKLDEWKDTFAANPAPDPCGGRFICYVSTIIGGLITSQIKKIIKEEKFDKSIMMHVDSLQVVKNFKF